MNAISRFDLISKCGFFPSHNTVRISRLRHSSHTLYVIPPNKGCHKKLYCVPMSLKNGMESRATKVFGFGMLQTGLGIEEQ